MSSAILRPEILVIGNRCYRVNPSSLPGLESTDKQSRPVYREEEDDDYYPSRNETYDDEPNCIPKQKRTTTEPEQKPISGTFIESIFIFDFC